MSLSTKARATVAMAVAMGIWGLSFLVVKDAVATIPIYWLLFVRFAIASVLLGGFLAFRRGLRLPRRDLLFLAGLSILSPIGYFLFETHGIALTQASHVALLIATIPIIVFLIAAARRQETFSWLKIVGIVGAFIGILITVGTSLNEPGASWIGDLLVLGAVLCAAIRTVLLKEALERISPMQLTFYQFLFSLVVFGPLAAATDTAWVSQLSPLLVGEVLFLGILCSAVAFLCLHFALKHLSASQVAVAANGVPIITLFAEAALLGVGISPLKAIGTAIVILSVTLAQIAGRRQERPDAWVEEGPPSA